MIILSQYFKWCFSLEYLGIRRMNQSISIGVKFIGSVLCCWFVESKKIEPSWNMFQFIQFDFIELLNLAKMLPETIFYYAKYLQKTPCFLRMIIFPTSKFFAPKSDGVTLGFPDGPGRPALANFTAMWPSPGGRKTCGWTTDVEVVELDHFPIFGVHPGKLT